MKKITLLLCVLFSYSAVYSQEETSTKDGSCGTDILNNRMLAEHPELANKMDSFEASLKTNKLSLRASAATYKIPIVVHVMHIGDKVGVGSNLSDAEIYAQIRKLNQNYRNIAGNSSAVDAGIEFELARRDPSNKATTGIVRYNMSGNSKFAEYSGYGVNLSGISGISDAYLKSLSFWDSTKYYNIWIVNKIDGSATNETGGFVTGYANSAAFHGLATDGAVIIYSSFRDVNDATVTHELGHALNLYHTFEGDMNSSGGFICPTGNGDYCNDTSPHQRFDDNCAVVPDPKYLCSGSVRASYYNNYMSYSLDVCRTLFTADQKTRLQAAISGARKSLLSTNGNLSLVPIAAPVADFIPNREIVIQTTQKVDFLDSSTSIPNNYFVDNAPTNYTFNWSVTNGTATLTSTAQNPQLTFATSGVYTVTHAATNSIGTNSKTAAKRVYVSEPPAVLTEKPTSETSKNLYTINYVSFNSIMNETDMFTNGSYQDLTKTNATLVAAGSVYTLTANIRAGDNASRTHYFAGYIDFNNNGTFEQLEKVAEGRTLTRTEKLITTDITIPATATKNTMLRMRLMGCSGDAGQAVDLVITNAILNGTATSTEMPFFCDVEDYGIYIVDDTVPTANFTASTSSILSGASVTFTDTSANTPTFWDWEISKAGTPMFASNLQNPSFVFTEIGTYTVKLTAYNTAGNNSKTVTNMITVNPIAPVADFTASATSVVSGTSVTFTDTTKNNPSTWAWDVTKSSVSKFTSTEQNPSFTFTELGTYTVKLTATNVTGNNIKTYANMITVNAPAPVASFTASVTSIGSGGKVTFTDTSTNAPTSWAWKITRSGVSKFTSALQNPVITFTETGSYTVELTATNASGNNVKSVANMITVTSPPPVASFTVSAATVASGENVIFTDTSTKVPTAWDWKIQTAGITKFTSKLQNPSFTLTDMGLYTVILTVTNQYGSDTKSSVNAITVTEPVPVANFTATSSDITVGREVMFKDTSTPANLAVSWNWKIVLDKEVVFTSVVQNPKYLFTKAGSYLVELTVANEQGRTNTLKVDNMIKVSNVLSTPVFRPVNLTVYPNPIEDVVNIKNDSKIEAVKIFNMAGQLVYSNNFNESSVTINVQNLNRGVYNMSILTEGKEAMVRVIKK